MKKVMMVLAVLAVALVIAVGLCLIIDLSGCDYGGYFSMNVDGVSCQLNLSEVTAYEKDGVKYYRAIFADSGKSADVSFSMWEEDGQVRLHLDNPTLKINGQKYLMPRPLKERNYSVDDIMDHVFCVTFYDVPYSDDFRLNGRMYLQVSGGKLY